MICKPKLFYDEKNKVAIGYKNPLCLTRAKQVQPALYNGHVLVMSNHARPVVHDSEDTRDMAEITRKRMMEKMQSPQCVENKVRIAPPPPDYSKENLLATFAPQRNLTPEQIFWSIDDNNRKKAKTLAPKPIFSMTELLEYVIAPCPKSFNERDNKAPSTPVTRKKQVTFSDKPRTSSSNTQKHKVHQKVQQTNVHVIHSITEASGSKPRSNTKKNRILPAKTENKKKVEDHPRTNKSVWTKVNRVDSSISSKHVVINSNSESGIQKWKQKSKLSDNKFEQAPSDIATKRKLPTGKKFTSGKLNCGYQWRPTGKKFALGELCPLTRLSVQCRTGHPLVSGLRLFKTYDGDRVLISKLKNLWKVHLVSQNSRKHSCFVRDINGADLLKGSRRTNLYTISIDDMMKSSPICLLSKASKSKSWLWHRRLNHLNFGTINDLARKDLVVSTKQSRYIRTDNGTEFVNQVMSKYYEGVGIFHQKSVPRTPQQNGVVERRNRTLVEAARTMLIFSKAPMFLWAEAVRTVLFTPKNRSLIHTRHNKTPYELVFLRVFGALCYPTNDSEDLGKFQAKADIGIFRWVSSYMGGWGGGKGGGDCNKITTREHDDNGNNSTSHSLRCINNAPMAPSTKSFTVILTSASSSPFLSVAAGPTIEDTSITQADLHPSDNPVAGEPSSAHFPPPTSGIKQLASDALWLLFHTELSKVEPKNFKMAVIEDCWFQAIAR
ncbi:integrase, catalytic region, zinc finger, CCHC-type containing protein [Tanacetum coccineum]